MTLVISHLRRSRDNRFHRSLTDFLRGVSAEARVMLEGHPTSRVREI